MHSRIKLSSPPHFSGVEECIFLWHKDRYDFLAKIVWRCAPEPYPHIPIQYLIPQLFFFFTRFDSSHFLATENSVKKGIFSYFMSKGFIVQFQLNIRSPNSFFSNDSILHILQVPKVYEVKETFFSFYIKNYNIPIPAKYLNFFLPTENS